MAKKPVPPHVKTHFEQVPVEEVKKIVEATERKPSQPGNRWTNVVREPASRKTEPYSIQAKVE